MSTVQRHRHEGAFAAALGLALVLVTAWLGSASGQPQVSVDMRGDRLTLRASGAPLSAVLARLATATGLVIKLRGRLEEPVTIELVDVTVEKALDRLLQGQSTVFVYDKGALVSAYVVGSLAVARELLPSSAEPRGTRESFPVESATGEDSVEIRGLARMNALEAELASGALEPTSRLQELQSEKDSDVRIAALHRLAARPEAAVDALASALVGSDLVEQGVAENILLNHPIDEQAVRQVMEAARNGDEGAVRLMVSALLMM